MFLSTSIATSQTSKPLAKPPAESSPPAPHTNAPLGEIKRMPGDGDGAYKTHHYRDLFAEHGASFLSFHCRHLFHSLSYSHH
ncbi:MAG TPA: hypothetical protein VJ731_05705 [Terriglobales bacterium]|nr:hypothetical protein [Terriglobales bacterium]